MLEHPPETPSNNESTHSAFLSGPYGAPYEFRLSRALKPTENEALVRVDYSGVCHGDVYSRDGGGPAPLKPRRPLTGGHEGIGEIVSLGVLTSTSPRFSVGERVGLPGGVRLVGSVMHADAALKTIAHRNKSWEWTGMAPSNASINIVDISSFPAHFD